MPIMVNKSLKINDFLWFGMNGSVITNDCNILQTLVDVELFLALSISGIIVFMVFKEIQRNSKKFKEIQRNSKKFFASAKIS